MAILPSLHQPMPFQSGLRPGPWSYSVRQIQLMAEFTSFTGWPARTPRGIPQTAAASDPWPPLEKLLGPSRLPVPI